MRHDLIKLGISQLLSLAERLKNLKIPRKDLNDFYTELYKCVEGIKNKDISGLGEDEKYDFKEEIELIKFWLISLEETVNIGIPPAMVAVLNRFAETNINNFDRKILLFCQGDYAVLNINADNLWGPIVERMRANYHDKHDVNLEKTPIIINLPKDLHKDYFLGVALLHEVGHKADESYNISSEVLNRIDGMLGADSLNLQLTTLLPFVQPDPSNKPNTWEWNNLVQPLTLIKEYVADLIGAQYAGIHVLENVEYRQQNKDGHSIYSATHPSLDCRRLIVDSFVKGATDNALLEIIKEEYKNAVKKDFLYKKVDLPQDNLLKKSKINISNDDELFSLFFLLWTIMKAGPSPMEVATGEPITHEGFYESLQNSINISISEYLGL